MQDFIYFDNNATTRTDDRVIEEMLPFMRDFYGNPSSSHQFGTYSKGKIEQAREIIAASINCFNSEVYFTSGATEAINMAIKGLAANNTSNRNKIITFSTEHKAVLETCTSLTKKGYFVEVLPVKRDGLIDLDLLKSKIDTSTLLVAAMLVNNETGVIQPVQEIGQLTHATGALFFCDGTQAIGKFEVDVKKMDIDIFCLSGHKFYGPKGVGALYMCDCILNYNMIEPLLIGGGQEDGLRSGTMNTPGIVGLGKACEIASSEYNEWKSQIQPLRDYLEEELLKIPGTTVNGSREHRSYNTTNISFEHLDLDLLDSQLDNICLSNGSACSSKSTKPSYVLSAMGVEDSLAQKSIRFSLGKWNNKKEVEIVIEKLKLSQRYPVLEKAS
ncbi:MAG: cysteine desulfurase [Leptospiraceae bacterium]|nr:cysteine desulfurase [Leptospiraceae bacterium]